MVSKKYLFGSKMLKLDNPRDEDWITFVDAPLGARKMGLQEQRIGFRRSVTQAFIESKTPHNDHYTCWKLYQTSAGFHDDPDYPFSDFNILEHKPVWIMHLKNFMSLGSTEQMALKGATLPKIFYHILYQYHMIVENTHWISDEAKVNVQKIHDLEMPSSYFYELKDQINNLEI